MSDTSANLSLPYLLPAQAQKHVTHNEALRALDALVMAAVESRALSVPPASPAEGARYLVAAPASGDWTGQEEALALWDAGGWLFFAPRPGWRVRVLDEALDLVWQDGAWGAAGGGGTPALLGVNTAADAVNRLAVASDATLLTHDGAGHQLKINKAGAGDTASLLFQSGWSGRAEMGLAGGDDWALKVSADGGTWTEALVVAASDGTVSGAAVQAAPDDVTPGRLARADYAYGPGNLLGTVALAAGLPTGAVLQRGQGAGGAWLRLADGTQLCWNSVTSDAAGPLGWVFPAGFTAAPVVTVTAQSGGAHLAGAGAVTASGADLSAWDLTGARVAVPLAALAVGRWG